MGVIGKTMCNSDAEDILIESGLCKQGTANNILLQQGITTKVCANTNYYGKQWLIYTRVHLNNGIWKEMMMHNSVDWLMACQTFAT